MRRIVFAVAALLVAGPALAQGPRPSTLGPGQVLQFRYPRDPRGSAEPRSDGSIQFRDRWGARNGTARPRGDGTFEVRDRNNFMTGIVRPRP